MSSMSTTSKRKNHGEQTKQFRMQYEVDETGYKLLEDIKARTSINTFKDLFSYTTTLFIWAVEEAEAGRMVGTYDEKDGKLRLFQMPPLLAAKARAEQKKAEEEEEETKPDAQEAASSNHEHDEAA